MILPAGENTWIVGTNKQWGLVAYDLDGEVVGSISRGRLNNVDALPTSTGFLLAASNRSEKSIDLFQAQPRTGELIFLSAIPIQVNDPYGLCMGERHDAFAIFVGGTDGDVQYWQVSRQGTNPKLIETLQFDSQTEGCVYDAQADALYVGEEATGVWRVALADNERSLFAEVDGQQLVADIEGLDLCLVNGERALLGSSQGDDSFLVWPLDQRVKSTKFRIGADPINGLDGASETDGIACSNQGVPGFPRGLLVVQDGRNRAPQQNQNFKYVDWRVLEALVSESR